MEKAGRWAFWARLTAAGLVLLLAVFALLYMRSYRSLREAIQQERQDYVAEISEQIITSLQFMRSEYTEAARSAAALLERGGLGSLSQARLHLSGRSGAHCLLMSTQGDLRDLDGRAVFLPDRLLPQKLSAGGEVQLFTSISNIGDYWIFASPLDNVRLDDVVYSTVIMAIPAEEFRDGLAISLFDGRGASYIVNDNGSIAIKPRDSAAALFGGYNLFASMLSQGANAAALARFEQEFATTDSGSGLIDVGATQWLISYSRLAGQEESIVVMIPLTLTAAQTYAGLSMSITFAVLLVFTLASFVLLLLLYFFWRERDRSREAMAVAAKSDFFAKMSHDIRTPLNAIIGMETMARDSLDDPAVAAECLDKSAAAADYLLSIINDVLDMSRIESGKLQIASQPFDMNQLLTDVQALILPTTQDKALHFVAQFDARFETAYLGDEVRIKQILMNLLSNAVKFTPENGTITLAVSHRELDSERDEFTLTVADTGIGMSEDYLSRIFTPFEQERSSFTQQHTGSGLGLSIVHSLVTLMGGAIAVESKRGEGSRFTVRLPLPRGLQLGALCEAQDYVPEDFAGRRILLVEDNQINQQVACSILMKRFGCKVELASNGREAVDLFTASPVGWYDAILMDVKMPVMDGLQATRWLRDLERSDAFTVPILALSANAFAEDVRLSLEAGMNDHLAKPIDVNALARTLGRLLK